MNKLLTGSKKQVVEVKLTPAAKISIKSKSWVILNLMDWFDTELLHVISIGNKDDMLMCAVLLEWHTKIKRNGIGGTFTINKTTAIALHKLMVDCYDLPLLITELKNSLHKLIIK